MATYNKNDDLSTYPDGSPILAHNGATDYTPIYQANRGQSQAVSDEEAAYIQGQGASATAGTQKPDLPNQQPQGPIVSTMGPESLGGNMANGAQIVPGTPTGNQINVVDAAGQIAANPALMVAGGTSLAAQDPNMTPEQIAAGVQGNAPQVNAGGLAQTAAQVTQTAQATAPTPTAAAPVTTATAADKIGQADMTAATGTVNPNAIVDPNSVQADINATANGQNALGQALNQSAQQNFTNLIDTSTLAGKLLAQTLGEGNYTDTKATVKGQLDILQGEFTDPATGEPRIPAWAAGTARNVGRIAAFKGMTGTAATAAMAQALMEASLPIAQADATFFQTLTVKNLDNRQEATINKANVLAKLDLANLDSRTQIAVNNANNFMKMDLANLDNEQQARVINSQARQQAILEDAKAENTTRLFMAESQNEKDMFYGNLEASISQFNASQTNNMKQFNASEVNDMSKFNADLENNREQFYKNMQFQIDTANAKWRQTVTLTENAQAFEAAATDVKNKMGISTEMLNRLWDRSDSILDYAWKSAESEADRKNTIAVAKLQAQMQADSDNATGTGNLIGTLLGIGSNLLFGW